MYGWSLFTRLLSLVGLFGVFMEPAAADNVVVKFQDYAGSGNMMVRVASSEGICLKHGLVCELQMIPSGPLGIQALLARSIDVAFPPPDSLVLGAVKGAAMKIIESGNQRPPFLIAAQNDLQLPDGNKDFKALMVALKGKRIGVPARGSGAEFQFGLLAKKAGVDPTDYTYVAVGAPNTSFGALKSKQIDASMTFEPSGTICVVLKACRNVYQADLADGPPEVVKTIGGAAEKVSEVALRGALKYYKAAVSRAAVAQVAKNMLEMGQVQEPFDTSRLFYVNTP